MLVAGLTLLVVATSLVVISAVNPEPNWIDVRSLNALLAAACAVVAISAGCMGVLRWRLTSDATAVRVGVALGVLGLSFVFADLVAFLFPSVDRHDLLGVLGTALTLTARGLLVAAVLAAPTKTRITLRGRILGAFAVVVLLSALVPVVPILDSFRRTSAGSLSGVSDWLARGAVISIWIALAVVSFVRWRTYGTRLFSWIALMSGGLALGATVGAFSVTRGDLWITAATTCTTGAALVVLYGMSQELKYTYLAQRARLFHVSIAAEERAARLRAEAADREERSHQARSAVLALQGATRMLRTNYLRNEDPMEQALRDAIETEIELLRRLVERQPSGMLVEFDLERVVRTVADAQRFLGLVVECTVEPGLRVIGRASETAEVIQALLDNARHHAPGSAVEIRSIIHDDHVELRVEDRGPGVASPWCEQVFDRSASSGHEGQGLGLYVGRRLMRDQQGDLRAESRPGGGAAFVLTFPAQAMAGDHVRRTADGVNRDFALERPVPSLLDDRLERMEAG